MPHPHRPLKLLIHGINYAPEFVGIGKYTSELAEWFAARGHHVRVHAARPYYPAWQVPADYTQDRDAETLNGVEVRRHAIYVPKAPSGLARIRHHLSWLLASRRALLSSAKSFDPDIVFAVAPSLIGAMAALQAARKAGAVSILHVQDFEVGAAGASGLIKSKALLRAAGAVERGILRRFDWVTTISNAMQKHLLNAGLSEAQTGIVRNWADIDAVTVKPSSDSQIRNSLGIGSEKTVLLYAGTISNKQGLETVIAAARTLKGRPDLVFLIFGEGPTKRKYESDARDLENVTFGPLVPFDELGDLLAAADIHLLPQIEGAADLVLPSKLSGMLASGRPVIATTSAGSGLSEEVEGNGIVVQPGSSDALAKAIIDLSDDRVRQARLGAQARRRAEAMWRKDAILEALEARLSESISRPVSSVRAVKD